MVKFKHLGMILTNDNCVQEEIGIGLDLGHACYCSIHNILSSYFQFKYLRNVYRTLF
jgi:hypothetical protein